MVNTPNIGFGHFSIKALKKYWDEGKIRINEEYQRNYIWKPYQRKDLIESIKKGFSMGVLVIWKNKHDQFEILDGQQRIKTIIRFLNNKVRDHNNKKFTELDTTEQSEIEGYSVCYLDLKSHLSEEELSDIFTRLQEGTPLNIAEKVNAFRGEFRKGFMRIFTGNPTFFSKIHNYRFRARFLAAQLLLLELEGHFDKHIFSNMRYKDFKAVKEKYKDELPQEKYRMCDSCIKLLGKSIHNQLELISIRDIVSIYLLVSYSQKRQTDISNLSTDVSKFVSYFVNNLNKFSIYDASPPQDMDVDMFNKYKEYKEIGRKATSSDSIERRFEFILSEYRKMFPNIKFKEELKVTHSGATIRPYDVLKNFEIQLRTFIQSELEKIDKNWWNSRIPLDVRQEAERRKNDNEKMYPWYDQSDLHPIHYVNFPEYAKIILKRDNWKHIFKSIFKEEDIISSKLKELDPIRNDIGHSRDLTEGQKEKLRMSTQEILTCFKKS